jgi:phosphate acetyltransferase
MDTLTSIIETAKLVRRRIVLSEGEDQRVIEAAFRANNTQLANPILIGDERLIKKKD